MNMKKLLLMLLFVTGLGSAFAQSVLWFDTFENATSPSSGTRTPEENGGAGSPYTAYFTRTDGTNISQVVSFTGKESTYYWAG